MPKPITELPFLEAMLWQEAWLAECAGDHALACEHAGDLAAFGYQVVWEPDALTLRHLYTGQEMRWPIDSPSD